MGTVELKSNLHLLIDKINNKELLESIYSLISKTADSKSGDLWSSLSNTQKEEVLEAYAESEKEENLISHNVVLKSLE